MHKKLRNCIGKTTETFFHTVTENMIKRCNTSLRIKDPQQTCDSSINVKY